MAKKIMDLRLIDKQLWSRSVLLKLRAQEEECLPEIFPGQFVQVRVDGSPTTYLRRPISVYYVDQAKQELWLLVQMVGDGTRTLSETAIGALINVMLPLGRPFSMPENPAAKLMLIGGGVGIAPLLYLGKVLKDNGFQPQFLLGARMASDLTQLDLYEEFGEVYVTTEDGSLGEKGFVTQHSVLANQPDMIYCCGPKPMMMAVARYAKEHDVFCELSLENTMACGLGACLCCVEDTKEGHQCVCQEGPVFNLNQLKW